MPNFNIVKTSECKKSFRVASVMGKFDLDSSKVTKVFSGNIELNDNWSVGLIVGASGTGKTTIAKKIFSESYIVDYNYPSDSILDDMPEEKSVDEITQIFNSVGFSSPPSWLRSYKLLSNGEKMRVDLARSILGSQNLVVFDEFTSVVDRDVAKIVSFATQKAIRKSDKKFIAVGCHYDVEKWLMPDWVFDTNKMKFHAKRRYHQRPDIELQIFETKEKSKFWEIFRDYHYLSHVHNNAARVFISTVNGRLAGFISILHFPHPKVKNMKKVHRLVILPDYQGCGIGKILLDKVAHYFEENRFSIVTSSPSLIYSLKIDKKWRCTHKGQKSPHRGLVSKALKQTKSRITTSWEYIF